MSSVLRILFLFIALSQAANAERLILVSASYGKNILAITNSKGDVLWSHKTAGPQRGHAGHHDCAGSDGQQSVDRDPGAAPVQCVCTNKRRRSHEWLTRSRQRRLTRSALLYP